MSIAASERFARPAFLVASALLFAASVTVTIAGCVDMAGMRGMRMPGDWTMSMTWMRMPGQTWPGAAASFLGTWMAMMTAMMLPVIMPTLWRYRNELASAGTRRPGAFAALIGAAYFSVWTALGAIAFPVGAALAGLAMRQPTLSRAAPLFVGVVVLLAGALQISAWKARHLARCGTAHSIADSPADTATSWRHGLCLGLHCCYACAPWTAILLATGVMDLRVMGFVSAGIAAERLTAKGNRVAVGSGIVALLFGLSALARAVGLR